MARTSSDDQPPVAGQDWAPVRALNERMAERVSQAQAQPLIEGGYALRVLVTRGRVSGLARRTPIGVLAVHGREWLIAPQRRRDWAANLRADQRCALLAGDQCVHRRAVPDEGERAAAAVARYLAVVEAPWALRAFPVSSDTQRSTIVEQLPAMAVFHLEPAGGEPGDAA